MTALAEFYPEEHEPILPVEEDLVEVDPLVLKRKKRLLFSRTDHGTRGNNRGRKTIVLPGKRELSHPTSVPLAELQKRDIERMRREGKEAAKVGLMDYLAERDLSSEEAELPDIEEELIQ